MSEFQVAKEVFLSLVKWFLVILLLNNLIWGLVIFGLLSGGNTDITQTQDGESNFQEMNNG